MSDFLRQQALHQRNEFNKHVSKRVREILDRTETVQDEADVTGSLTVQRPRPITWDEYQRLVIVPDSCDRDTEWGINSYERRLVHARLDDDAFIRFLEESVAPYIRRPLGKYDLTIEYDDSVLREFFPALIERLRKHVHH